MKILKFLVKYPPLLIAAFLLITFFIWVYGKSYKTVISSAEIYTGNPVSAKSIGKLVISEGMVIDNWKNKQGIQFFKLEGKTGKYEVSFFPSLGKLPLTPRKGDLVRVIGLLDTYKEQPQISPISSQSITKITDEEKPIFNKLQNYPTVDFIKLNEYMGETVWINHLYVKSIEKFTSKKGFKMLRFRAYNSNGESVQGVFFEGNWNEETVNLLLSKQSINMLATIGKFRDKISLNVKKINLSNN